MDHDGRVFGRDKTAYFHSIMQSVRTGMLELFDEDFDAMELVEGALILNLAVDPDTQIDWSKQELHRLLTQAEYELAHEVRPQARVDAFLRLFYHEWKFHGDQDAFFHSNNAFIDKVLEKRKGIPLSLGALLLFFGRKLGFPFSPVMFPTQFLVQVHWPEQPPMFINPFSGEYVSKHTLQAWLIGHKGPLTKLKSEDLNVVDHPTIIGRWLALLKSAMMREERFLLALRCTDIALSFVPYDPHEIRDRGYIYQQLECNHVALTDYRYFIEHCPDDPAAELLKSQVRLLSYNQVTLH
jgi:regulator of sirC expression with transglutaminase-like and TPR domain